VQTPLKRRFSSLFSLFFVSSQWASTFSITLQINVFKIQYDERYHNNLFVEIKICTVKNIYIYYFILREFHIMLNIPHSSRCLVFFCAIRHVRCCRILYSCYCPITFYHSHGNICAGRIVAHGCVSPSFCIPFTNCENFYYASLFRIFPHRGHDKHFLQYANNNSRCWLVPTFNDADILFVFHFQFRLRSIFILYILIITFVYYKSRQLNSQRLQNLITLYLQWKKHKKHVKVLYKHILQW
jgi:hypothetical protein